MHYKTKIIKRKPYKYAVKSIRLPDNVIKKIEVMINGRDKDEIEKIMEKKMQKIYTNFAIAKYQTDYLLSKDEIEKIEIMRYSYKKILRNLSKVAKKDLFDRFTANFTYESNALEGNSLTLKDVVIVMFENLTIKGKDLREIYETRNSRIIVEGIINNKFSINHEDIIKIHRTLVKDMDINAGYKKLPNFILGRNIKTTPPERVFEEMDQLIKWYNQNKEKIHPLKIAALFHGKFEKIHPFEDGNGRVGRFLINVILVNHKYPPLILRNSQRLAYLKALEKFDGEYYDALERLLLNKFKETYRKFFEVYIKYI
ncbi:Fic family protein [Candidatus Woesearchaeota archaeon]|nr:Fic family protein [Candidatus Woesearchaeota archaeon]